MESASKLARKFLRHSTERTIKKLDINSQVGKQILQKETKLKQKFYLDSFYQECALKMTWSFAFIIFINIIIGSQRTCGAKIMLTQDINKI